MYKYLNENSKRALLAGKEEGFLLILESASLFKEIEWPTMELPKQIKRELESIVSIEKFSVAVVTDRTVRDCARLIGLDGENIHYMGEEGLVSCSGLPTPENQPIVQPEARRWLEPASELVHMALQLPMRQK